MTWQLVDDGQHNKVVGTDVRGRDVDVRVGDWVFVDPFNYTGRAELTWCPVEHIALGDASIYPIKVTMPNGARGQFKPGEVYAVRR